MRGWLRSRIHLVGLMYFVGRRAGMNTNGDVDCPEREATYIITNGGISDPEKI